MKVQGSRIIVTTNATDIREYVTQFCMTSTPAIRYAFTHNGSLRSGVQIHYTRRSKTAIVTSPI